jgi:hypothetical protein
MSGTIGGVSSMYTQGQLDQMKETEKLVRNTINTLEDQDGSGIDSYGPQNVKDGLVKLGADFQTEDRVTISEGATLTYVPDPDIETNLPGGPHKPEGWCGNEYPMMGGMFGKEFAEKPQTYSMEATINADGQEMQVNYKSDYIGTGIYTVRQGENEEKLTLNSFGGIMDAKGY